MATNENSVVCDPFAGSATSGIAANLLGRNFIGIEKESIDFSVVTNQYNNNDWLGCGGKISQNDIFILKTSSKSMAQIVAKSKMKKMDNEIMVEDIALTSFCLNMGKSVKKLIDKNYCKF